MKPIQSHHSYWMNSFIRFFFSTTSFPLHIFQFWSSIILCANTQKSSFHTLQFLTSHAHDLTFQQEKLILISYLPIRQVGYTSYVQIAKNWSSLGGKTHICIWPLNMYFTIKHLIRTDWNKFHSYKYTSSMAKRNVEYNKILTKLETKMCLTTDYDLCPYLV